MNSVLLIAGATASGKSAYALEVARQRKGVIINADALQIYRELEILSARPDASALAKAPHELYGIVSGATSFSVANWLTLAKPKIAQAWAVDRLAIVVGGTGLYFKALEQGLAEVPTIAPDIRKKWRDYEGSLHEALKECDAHGAGLLHPADRQRLSRALEVIEATGQPLRHWQAQAQGNAFLNGTQVERVFLNVEREELYERADQRFEAMMQTGAVAEVEKIRGYDPSLPMMKAIGVKELMAYLEGECSLEEAVREAQLATRHYIKRQLTWWRGQMQSWRSVS